MGRLHLDRGGKEYDIKILKGIVWYFNDEVLWFVRAIIWLYVFFAIYRKINRCKLLALFVLGIIAIWWTDSGLVHGSSVFLFFIGVSIAEYGDVWWRTVRRKSVILIYLSALIIVGVLFHNNAFVLHLLFDLASIFVFIVFSAYYNIQIVGCPRWMSACSYDIYLVHNKALMLLRPCYAVLPLLPFAGLTFLFTIAFFWLRKILKI